jgi:hypothetical protein
VSDASQGPGWWQASDGKWYPPEQAPGYQAGDAAGGGGAVGGGGGSASLDFGSAFSWAWTKFMADVGVWVMIALAYVLVVLVFFGLGLVINSFFLSLALRLVGYVVGAMVALGLIRAALASTRGEKPDVAMLFQTDHLGDYIVATIVYGAAVFVGTLLCCIPGIIAYVFLAFYGFYIIDRDAGAMDALSASWNLVKDNLGNVIVLMLIAWVLLIVGYATCGIVLVVTGPLAYLLLAYGFKTLNGEPVAAA